MTLVAVIDDDEGIRDAMTFLLDMSGYSVVAYESALAFLANREPAPEYLIVDQNMPGMTGIELAAALQSEQSAIPFMLISGVITTTLESAAIRCGINTVMQKPIECDEILRFLAEN